jgi:hypothetical protein
VENTTHCGWICNTYATRVARAAVDAFSSAFPPFAKALRSLHVASAQLPAFVILPFGVYLIASQEISPISFISGDIVARRATV